MTRSFTISVYYISNIPSPNSIRVPTRTALPTFNVSTFNGIYINYSFDQYLLSPPETRQERLLRASIAPHPQVWWCRCFNSLQWSSFLIFSQLQNSFTQVSLEASAANRNTVDSDNRGKQTGHPCDDYCDDGNSPISRSVPNHHRNSMFSNSANFFLFGGEIGISEIPIMG